MAAAPPLLTSAEARKILRCSRSTLARYLSDGLIRGSRLNSRRTLYHRDSILQALNASGSTDSGSPSR